MKPSVKQTCIMTHKIVRAALQFGRRWYSNQQENYAKIRNIGIIAHIDAGKTTTTENMLYHAGKIRRMGKVDSGNTVTDYLPSERDRGITVQSAAVSFDWNKYFINLIDTPGHVDFTIEVERALYVLDGAVAIVDGTRGVEAQTRMVWRQADKLQIPRIVFVNKMDKPGADYFASITTLENHLLANTLIMHYPIINDNEFHCVADAVDMRITGKEGDDVFEAELDKHVHNDIFDECVIIRKNLIEKLSDIDDDIAELYLGMYSDDVCKFPSNILKSSISKAVMNNDLVPVLCGSAYKDIGVNFLLDAVTDFLPAHYNSRIASSVNVSDKLIAYAFKVIHHKQLGPVVFIRVLSGSIHSKNMIYNASKSEEETPHAIFRVFADEYQPISNACEGDIVAVTGLKKTATGDTLHSSKKDNGKILDTISIPQPVYFCTVEAGSPTEAKALEICLLIITREDPSIQVKTDATSGQTTLCGMGELHMDILVERLRKEFNLKCYIGPIQVAYREKVNSKIKDSMVYEKKLLERTHNISLALSINPNAKVDDCSIKFSNISASADIAKAVKDGIRQACASGPLLGFPLIHTEIKVLDLKVITKSPPTIVTAAAACMTTELLQRTQCGVLEPIMDIHVITNGERLPDVLRCLAQKHAEILQIEGDAHEKHVSATAPVSEMLGFASLIRKMSSGNADLTMKVAGYVEVPDCDIERLRNRMLGVYD